MAAVGQFTSRGHAEVAASMLRAHGIDASVASDDAGGAAPHLRFGTGGIVLHVAAHRREESLELLAHDRGVEDPPTPAPARRTRVLLAGRVLAGAMLLGVAWTLASSALQSLG